MKLPAIKLDLEKCLIRLYSGCSLDGSVKIPQSIDRGYMLESIH